MTAVLFTLLAVFAVMVQTLLPRWAWTGSLDWPVLTALLMVCVLNTERRAAAIYSGALAGLFYDLFSPAPLGLSIPFFLAVAAGLHALKGELFSDHWITYCVLGPAVVTLKTLYLFTAYSLSGLRPGEPGLLAARLASGLLLGALTAPLVYSLVSLLPARVRGRGRRRRML